MKWSHPKVSFIGLFCAATIVLILYLLSMRYHICLSVIVFWIAVGLMLCTILCQSLCCNLSSRYAKMILLEIVVTCLVFHLIYQMPYYGLRGSDAYIDMASVKGILFSGFIIGDSRFITGTSYWPMIHLLGTQLTLITNLDLFFIVKWYPSLIDVVVILVLYLLTRKIFKKETIALLSALLFSCMQHHILFSSLFIRETLALILALCCIYFYFSAKASIRPTACYALSIICLLGTVFSHHLTSFMLFLFLSVHFIVSNLYEFSLIRKTFFSANVVRERMPLSILLVVSVSIFGYWIYVTAMSPLFTLFSLVRDVLTPSLWGMATYSEIAGISSASLQTTRGYVLFYGFYFFILIFGIILLHQLLLKRKKSRIETVSFTLFLFICGVVGFMSLYLIPSAVYPDRLLMFGWLFGFPPLVLSIVKVKCKWFRRIGIFLLVSYMFFNIYMIEPTAWNSSAEGVSAATSLQDYAIANTFDFTNATIVAHQNELMAIYDVHNTMGRNIFALKDTSLFEFDWVIVQKEALRLMLTYLPEPSTEVIVQMKQLMGIGTPGMNKIFDSNTLVAFKLRK